MVEFEDNPFFQSIHSVKGSVSRDFRPLFFYDSNPSGPLINRPKYFRIRFSVSISPRYSITKFKKFDFAVCIKILVLADRKIFLQIFSFMIGVFTPKRIAPDCTFKSSQRLTKILILTLRCAVGLCDVMHIVGCTLRS